MNGRSQCLQRFAWLMLWPLLLLAPAASGAEDGGARFVEVLQIDGAIGPGVGDYLVEAIDEANHASPDPELIIITLDTPGGLVTSLREINLAVLASRIPIACLVHPPGARAASAGTYLLYACHIAAMAPATTLGAATPIQIGAPTPPSNQRGKGKGEGEDEESAAQPAALEKKILNDSIAYIRSLAQLRGRNAEWAELAVREAATLTADEALAENVIDYLADDPVELARILHGVAVEIDDAEVILDTAAAEIRMRAPDWRNRFITAITDPNIAYILLLVGIYGLILEFYNPGMGIGGVVGGIALLLALYALHPMPVNFVGVALLLLGIGLLAAEAMMPSFGIMGFGGLVAFVLGSIFLLDTEFQPYRIAYPLIAAVAVASALFLSIGLGMIWRGRRKPVVSGLEAILGAEVVALGDFEGEGEVLMAGERWHARAEEKLSKGQSAVVTAIEGLLLHVRAQPYQEKEDGNDIR
jgi:membrane-bound serine protease (ClpP class)